MPWYDVLKVVRRMVDAGGEISSRTVGLEAEMPTRIASMWLSKMVRWGYLRRISREPDGKRWSYRYELTRWGQRFKPAPRKRRS